MGVDCEMGKGVWLSIREYLVGTGKNGGLSQA
jgi:hypothetical protein